MRILGVILLGQFFSVGAYSSGPPEDACQHMIPGHGAPPQDSESPFEVLVDDLSYTPNSRLRVTLRSTDGSTTFKGFLLQARLVEDDDVLVGHFTTDGATDTKTMCNEQALTHTTAFSSQPHSSVTVTWVAPNTTEGHMQFRATFVNEYLTFWVDVQSDVIVDPSQPEVTDPTDYPITVDTTHEPITDIDLTRCGSSKSCVRSPSSCESADACDVIVTWSKNDNNQVNFEVSGVAAANRYWAIGLSENTAMADTSVMDCIHDESASVVTVQMSYNGGFSNSPLSNPQLGLVPGSSQGSYQNGRLICRFSRDVTASDANLYDLLGEYHLMMATGPAFSGVKSKHESDPVVTSAQLNLTSAEAVDIGGIKPSYPLIKAHAIMMVLAWMFFASIGVLMPRHMKTAWSQWKPFGKQVWFVIHQPFMILAALLTLIGIVLAFVEAQGYSNMSGFKAAHPPIGITVGVLVVINPIMSLFRCTPDDPRRSIFNIAHLLVGQSAHLLAVVAIFLGLYTGKAGLPDWTRWVMVAFIVWHFICEIVLFVDARLNKSSNKGSYSPDTETQNSAMDFSTSAPSLKTIVACLHFIGVASFALTLVVLLGIT